jgi:nifR3 family TIM-barrel protein
MSMTFKPFKIGSLSVDFPVALAPMAGYSDSAFRMICKRFHCGLMYTELVNSEALVRGSRATFFLLESDPAERPLGAHLYGSSPATLAEAAAMIEKLNRFDLIDLNCGCPMRKIVGKGAGAALMDNPDKVKDLLRAMTGSVSMPVTAKLRLGLSPRRLTVFDVAQAAEEGGACAIAVHTRFAADKHRGPANWKILAELKSQRKIPIIGNGGILRPSDAAGMMSETGVDAVMIGRAAIGNPWIFQEIRSFAAGRNDPPPSPEERQAVILAHFAGLIDLKKKDPRHENRKKPPRLSPEAAATMLFRAHLIRYVAGLKGCGAVRKSLNSLRSPEDVRAVVERALPTPA